MIQGERDSKTPHDVALRHIAALRKAGPVRLYTAGGGGHFVLWPDTLCARAEVRTFVLGKDEDKRCAGVRADHRGAAYIVGPRPPPSSFSMRSWQGTQVCTVGVASRRCSGISQPQDMQMP